MQKLHRDVKHDRSLRRQHRDEHREQHG
jgi:hypothetical protein